MRKARLRSGNKNFFFCLDFDTSEIPFQKRMELLKLLRPGFTGSNNLTLWKNLHARVEKPFLSAKYFKKVSPDSKDCLQGVPKSRTFMTVCQSSILCPKTTNSSKA